ncbi:MAG: PQQ-binding-like beta-propeller repeat protein [Ktedonobacterales bacterium]
MSHTPYEPGDSSDPATLPPELRQVDRSLSEDGRIWRNQLPSEQPVTRRVQALGAGGPDGMAPTLGGSGSGRPPRRAPLTRMLAPVAAMILVVALLATGFYVFALNGKHAKQPIVQKTATAAIAQHQAPSLYFTGGATVYALHSNGGSVLWKQTFANASYLLGVDGAMLFAGAASDNGDGFIYGLDKTTGAVKWQLPGYVPGGSSGGLFAAANGAVYMAVATQTSTFNTLYAVNGQTGVVLWQQPFKQPPIAPNATTPPTSMMTVIGKQLYITLGGSMHSSGAYVGDLDVLDAATGALQWRHALQGDLFNAPPLVANGVVYAAGYTSLYAFDAQTGAARWTAHYPSYPDPDPATLFMDSQDGQSLIVVNGAGVSRYDSASGAISWTKSLSITYPQSALVANGLIYAPVAPVSNDGHILGTVVIVALNASNGKQVWSFPFNEKLQLAGTSDNTLFVTAGPAPIALLALNPRTGTLLWQRTLNASIMQFTGVQFYGSSVFCSTFTDQVFAFSATDGASLWSFTTSGSNINNLLVE